MLCLKSSHIWSLYDINGFIYGHYMIYMLAMNDLRLLSNFSRSSKLRLFQKDKNQKTLRPSVAKTDTLEVFA